MRRACVKLEHMLHFLPTRLCRGLTMHHLDILYLLPISRGASCRVNDIKELSIRCGPYLASVAECVEQRCIHRGEGIGFDEGMQVLKHMGLVCTTSDWSDSRNDTVGTTSQRVSRTPTITVKLSSVEASSLPRESDNNDNVLLLLHGVVIPYLFSHQLSSRNLPQQRQQQPSPQSEATHCLATTKSSPDQGNGEWLTDEACLALLQPKEVSAAVNNNKKVRQIVSALLSRAVLAGVHDGVLHQPRSGSFCFHHDVIRHPTLRLLALQLWWNRKVEPFVRENVQQHGMLEDVPRGVWMEVAQRRVQDLLVMDAADSPKILHNMSREEVLDFVVSAINCWNADINTCRNKLCGAALPSWGVQLSGSALVTVMKDLIQTVNAALGRRAAGLSISELSSQVGWPSFSALVGKKSLLKTLTQFPSHFRIYNVEGTLVVQQVIPGATSYITTDEVCAWLAGAEGEFSQQRASSPAVHAINREVDIVVRAVTFLRKQWLRRRAVTFAELSTVISPHRKDSEETNCDQFLLSILYRYDVVMGINSVGDNYFITSEDQKVQLSLREEQALRALEAFRTTCMTTEELHKEAIQPFLMCCRKAVPETAAVLPIALLKRWLQVERLSLEHEELARMINVSGGPYRVDEETCHIHLVDCIETEKTLDSPDVPFISSPKCPLTAGSITSDHFTFDSQLLRVLRAQHPDGLLHFVRNVVHAVFDVLLPHVSIPSGITFRKLQPRVRWGPLAVTLGSLISFVDAFDGLFFDVVRVASMSGGADTGDDAVFSVSAYQGPLGPHLLYARLIARLFPVDVDFPLGLMAESLSWGRWFAPMFGDLVSFLRSVGRQCRNGHLLARKGAAMTGCHNNSDIRLWELLVMVREAVSQHSLSNDSGGSAEYAILSSEELKNLLPNKMAANQGDRSLSDNKCDWNMVLAAARRFPLFFQLCDVEDDAPHRVRVAMPNAVLTEGTVRFVEEYVCPLLRQHRRATITELDERLGWSRGSFDDHPTGMRVTGYRASDCSLYGVLKRYVEGCQQPHIILVEQTPILPQLHDNIHVMPNDAAYMSPEDMLLEVNGLRPVCVEEGCFQLRPVGRPVSLFELVSEESELQAFPSTDGVMLTAREEKWPVMLTCESDEPDDWVRELSNGTGDILVWCGEGSCDR